MIGIIGGDGVGRGVDEGHELAKARHQADLTRPSKKWQHPGEGGDRFGRGLNFYLPNPAGRGEIIGTVLCGVV